MLIILLLCVVLIWLIFFKLKSLPFNWLFGSLAAVVGVSIAVTFVGLLSYLTPSGRIEVMGKVDEVTPNVSGQVTEIPVQRNVPLKAGTVLFQIDRAPYEYKVRQLAAALAEARQKVGQLNANVDATAADVKAMEGQWQRADKRREDLEQLGVRQATSQFNVQDATAQANALAAQRDAAKAREISARLAATSEINGENTTVAQLAAQLENAQWELAQTTVRAPADGYVAASTLAVGDRVSPSKSAMASWWQAESKSSAFSRRTGSRASVPARTSGSRFSALAPSAYWVIGIFVLAQIWNVIAYTQDGVAYWAHLGGLLAGAALLPLLRRPHVVLFECLRTADRLELQ